MEALHHITVPTNLRIPHSCTVTSVQSSPVLAEDRSCRPFVSSVGGTRLNSATQPLGVPAVKGNPNCTTSCSTQAIT